jgi:hypothetical protein
MKKNVLSVIICLSLLSGLTAYAAGYKLVVKNNSSHTWLPYNDSEGHFSPVWEDDMGGEHNFSSHSVSMSPGFEQVYYNKDASTISFTAYEHGHGNKVDSKVCELVVDPLSSTLVSMYHCELTVRSDKDGLVYVLSLLDSE